MSTCRNCKLLTDINREVASNCGWCPLWSNWQKCNAASCKYFEAKVYNTTKPIYNRNTNQKFKGKDRVKL